MSFVWDYLLDTIDPVDLLVSIVTYSAERVECQMPPKAVIVHHAKGRVRLRVPQKRYDEEFFQEVSRRLVGCDIVKGVHINPTAASVLVLYDGDVPTLLHQALAVGVSDLVDIQFPSAPQPLTQQLAKRLQNVDRAIAQRTYGGVNGGAVVVSLLIAAAGVELVRGRVFGAIPMLWYAGQAVGMVPTAPAARLSVDDHPTR